MRWTAPAIAVFGVLLLTRSIKSDESPAQNASVAQAKAAVPAATGWRGDGSGIFASAAPPIHWDSASKKGILWTAKVGKGMHGSPIVVGNKVLVLSEPDLVTCLDAESGKQLWNKTTTVNDLAEKATPVEVHVDVGHTTPTPVSDGENVYVEFADGLVTCIDLDGNRKWVTFVNEPCTTGNGRSASPCLAGGKLVLSAGGLVALDAKTGKQAWKAAKIPETFGTPIAARIGESAVIISPAGQIVSAADGSILAKTSGELTYTSPIVSGDTAYFIDTDSCAVKLAKGAAAGKKLWQHDLDGEFFSSPICHDGLIYAVNNLGQLFVLDTATGQAVYDKELDMGGDADVVANCYPSICLAGNHIFISNDRGHTLVLEPGRAYKEIARNALTDTMAGSMAFSGKCIFVRGSETVYCLGE